MGHVLFVLVNQRNRGVPDSMSDIDGTGLININGKQQETLQHCGLDQLQYFRRRSGDHPYDLFLEILRRCFDADEFDFASYPPSSTTV